MEAGQIGGVGRGLVHRHSGGLMSAARLLSSAAGLLLIGAGTLHVSAAGDHGEQPVMVVGFLIAAYLQVGLGVLLVARRPGRLLIVAGAAITAACVGLWLVSRTAGLPLVPGGHREPVGFKDSVCVLFELATLPPLLLLARADLHPWGIPPLLLGTRALGTLGAGMLFLLAPALALDSGHRHSHGKGHLLAGHTRAGGAHLAAAYPGAAPTVHAGGGQHARRHAGGARGHRRGHASTRHATAGTGHAAHAQGHTGHLVAGVVPGHVHEPGAAGGQGHLGGSGHTHARQPSGHTHRKGGSGNGHGRHGGQQHAGGGNPHAGHPPDAAGGGHHRPEPEPEPANPVDQVAGQVTELLPPRRKRGS